MTNEELIMQRLDRIEQQLAPLSESMRSMIELKEDIGPLANNAVKHLIQELQEVESSFQLEFFLLAQLAS